MIIYAMIVRTMDGMPLSASMSVETYNQPIVSEAKRYLKVLAKQVKNMKEDRCSLPLVGDRHLLHFTTAIGVCYMALCESKYPNVLAFSFIDELVKEFITTYTTVDVSSAQRPYSFIQFDGVVQKTRQRYNNPSSLATKINLSDLSLEIRLRPPHQMSLDDIRPPPIKSYTASASSNGSTLTKSTFSNTVVPLCKLLPVTWFDVITILLIGLCAIFNFIRGILALSQSRFEDDDGTSPFHGCMLIIEGVIQSSQIVLLLNGILRRHQLALSILLLFGLCVCNISLWDVRDLWQTIVHAIISAIIAFRTLQRKPRKIPNHDV